MVDPTVSSSSTEDSISSSNTRVSECLSKDTEESTWKKPLITRILKIKVLVICTKYDRVWWRHLNLTSCCLSSHKILGLDQENAESFEQVE